MLSFFAVGFAVAGAALAAGPTVIHLLNRRRFRVVHWAAMDFLLDAVQRNRRMLQLRDWLLLALRTLCVLLFGLAMAQPYISQNSTGADANQPVHAVLLVDNSLSMGRERLGGTLLDEAKAKAKQYIERLPNGSRASVLPVCGAAGDYSRDAYRTKEDAYEALAAIEVVDRAASSSAALDMAVEALSRSSDLPAKRVVLVGDQQLANWPADGLEAQLKRIPELQVVRVGAESIDNSWVSDFRLQDDIADVETPTAFVVSVRHEGAQPRTAAQISLLVDGVTAATQTVDLEPGQTRELRFPYRFDVPAEPGRPVFAAAEARIADDPSDRLPLDNARFLVVPVLAALPVLFIDQLGELEQPAKGQYGETFRLRRLLAPMQSRDDADRQLIQVRHAGGDDYDRIRTMIPDARLVVLAGVERPSPELVQLLRDYARQGGQVVVCAGGGFDPAAWNAAAWLDGAGLLPTPLETAVVGQTPEEATTALTPWRLDPRSMVHDLFLIEEPNREDLFRDPYFFKFAASKYNDALLAELLAAETKRVTEARGFVAEYESRRREWGQREAQGKLDAAAQAERASELEKLAELNPTWLAWHNPRLVDASQLSAEDEARRSLPQVLARLDNGAPIFTERRLGMGRVLFFGSGVLSNWNTLTKTYSVVLFDRVFRSLLEETLPRRNYASGERILAPVEAADRRARFTLSRPNAPDEPLAIEALGPDLYGISVRNAVQRGVYRVTAYRDEAVGAMTGGDPTADMLGTKQRETLMAVNGPEDESSLVFLNKEQLTERVGQANVRWIDGDEEISLAGAHVHGRDWWKTLMFFVLAGLLAELAVLVWPTLASRGAPTSDAPNPGGAVAAQEQLA